ncbi:PEP-CTERM sorting domain-containing protein [Chitinimonas sp. PSY-7]|uniref:PEP-CTERM sorting domain-containing protein n=1 Tax=Chitinimonas sp. PSY-7 TaxID=3459088 RepID=UPI0040400269
MQFKKLITALALAGVTAMGSAAHAMVVQDAWTMDAGGTTTTNIGHLGLNGGDATVLQQLGIGGTPFVGAQFVEFGQIFSLNYVTENSPGFGDFGFPMSFAQPLDGLRFVFSGLSGVVTAYNSITGAINYSFTPGVGTIKLQATSDSAATWVDMADLSMRAPSGGDLADFNGANQTLGQSTLLVQFDTFLNGFSLDLDGPGLGYSSPTDLFMQVQTTNKISNPFTFAGPCPFNEGTAFCARGRVTSDGSADLLRVPEPGSVALIALGLLGIGAISRRRITQTLVQQQPC